MGSTAIVFKNRQDAGIKLANLISHYSKEKPIVLGLPRGGVVVGSEIAKALNAPLDVIVARKLGAPFQPEYAIGAIAGDVLVTNDEAISSLGISEAEFAALIQREKKEMVRRIGLYRRNKQELDLKNRVVIIVDDGVATGFTALAAIRFARKMQPQKIIFACGVCAQDAAILIRREVDEFYSVSLPESLYAIGEWFMDFSQTTDEEVISLLGD